RSVILGCLPRRDSTPDGALTDTPQTMSFPKSVDGRDVVSAVELLLTGSDFSFNDPACFLCGFVHRGNGYRKCGTGGAEKQNQVLAMSERALEAQELHFKVLLQKF